MSSAIAPKLEQAEIERVKRKPTESLDAYDCFLRGLAGLHQWSRDGNEEALAHFYRAIELDPNFAAADGLRSLRCWALWGGVDLCRNSGAQPAELSSADRDGGSMCGPRRANDGSAKSRGSPAVDRSRLPHFQGPRFAIHAAGRPCEMG